MTEQTPAQAPEQPEQTIVTFVLDRSGSMSAGKDSTLEAFNAYVAGLKADGDGIRFSLVQFDTMGIETTWKNAPIADVDGLTDETYQPRGGTPLIDAAYKTIKAVEKKIAEYAATPKIVICIQTDGEENSSTEYGWAELNALIKEKVALGWQFNFMGAGIDAYVQSQRMGLSAGQTMSYDREDRAATRSAFAASAKNVQSYRKGLSRSTDYNSVQKLEAGDRFAPDLNAPQDASKPNGAIAPNNVAHSMAHMTKTKSKSVSRTPPPIVDDLEL